MISNYGLHVRCIWSICALDQMRCASGKCAFDINTNPNPNPNPNRNPIPNPNCNPKPYLDEMLRMYAILLNAHI